MHINLNTFKFHIQTDACVMHRIRAMVSFEKLGGPIFFENCKEVWGHASLKNLKYRYSEVQSC